MSERVRILFLSARVPYPLDVGGKLRTFHLLRSLGARHEVTLLTFASTATQTYPRPLCEACQQIVVVHNPLIDGNSVRRLAGSLTRLMPYTVSKYTHPELRAALERLHGEHPFDLVHCDHMHMGQYLELLPRVPSILDEHNIESLIWQRQAAETRGPQRVFFATQQRLMRRYERMVCGRAQGVITCSDEDRRWVLDEARQPHARVVPNGVDTELVRPGGDVALEPRSLVFVGSMDWLPNREGILHFHARIWPRLRQRVADLTCHVVGRNPDADVRSLGEHGDGFVVTGGVPDVRPYIERSAVYVVPLYVGGGTRLKILEAFAMHKCVVSTALGAEGIEYTDGDDILIARDDEHFVEQVVAALQEPDRAAAIGASARELVERRYDWAQIGEQLCGFVDETLARSSAAQASGT